MSGQRDDRPLAHGFVKWTGCPATGKRGFATRGDAKRAIRRGQLQGEGLHPYTCQHCGNFHVGHHAGLAREDHRAYHAGRSGRGEAEPTWLTMQEVVARLKPTRPAKMRAVLERMAAEGLIQAEGALGITLIHRDEVPRLMRAAHDSSQDERLKGL